VAADGNGSRIEIRGWNATATGTAPDVAGVRARGTEGSPSAVLSGDVLMQLHGYGYGATGYSSGARSALALAAAENWTDTAQGTQITFATTPTGSTSVANNMVLQAGGILTIGTTVASGTNKLQVTGGATIDNLNVGGTLAAFPIGAGLTLTGGSLAANSLGGSITAFATGLTLTTGTLTPNWQAGVVNTIGNGLALNSGTVSIDNSVTLTGTNAGTTTIAPGSGTVDVVVNMPTTAGTVTLAASPAFIGQRARMRIKYGATISTPSLNTGFIFGNSPSAYTPGTVVNAFDDFMLIANSASQWGVYGITQGMTA